MNWAGKKNDTTGAKMIPYFLFCEYWRKPVYILQFFVLWSSQITCCWSCYCFKHFCMFDLTKSHNMTEGTHCMQWSGGGLSVFVLKSQLLLKNGDFWLKFQKMDIKRDSNMAPSMTHLPPTPLGGCQNPLHPLSDHENLTVTTGTVSVVQNSQMMSLVSQKNDTIQRYHFFTNAVVWSWVGVVLFSQCFL